MHVHAPDCPEQLERVGPIKSTGFGDMQMIPADSVAATQMAGFQLAASVLGSWNLDCFSYDDAFPQVYPPSSLATKGFQPDV